MLNHNIIHLSKDLTHYHLIYETFKSSSKVRNNDDNKNQNNKGNNSPQHKLIFPNPQHHRLNLPLTLSQIMPNLHQFILILNQLPSLINQFIIHILSYLFTLQHNLHWFSQSFSHLSTSIITIYKLTTSRTHQLPFPHLQTPIVLSLKSCLFKLIILSPMLSQLRSPTSPYLRRLSN